jgi:hypothetical protein
VFHEGYKYWSCCPSSKTTEFQDFLGFVGCQRATCVFVDDEAALVRSPAAVPTACSPRTHARTLGWCLSCQLGWRPARLAPLSGRAAAAVTSQMKKAKCRHDFYQVGSTINMSIYAKKAVPAKCSFQCSAHQLRVSLTYDAVRRGRRGGGGGGGAGHRLRHLCHLCHLRRARAPAPPPRPAAPPAALLPPACCPVSSRAAGPAPGGWLAGGCALACPARGVCTGPHTTPRAGRGLSAGRKFYSMERVG